MNQGIYFMAMRGTSVWNIQKQTFTYSVLGSSMDMQRYFAI